MRVAGRIGPNPKKIEAIDPVHDRAALQKLADDIARRMTGEVHRGSVATYIPKLSNVDINCFGLAIAPIVARDADIPFSIQSVSKVFSLNLGLVQGGRDPLAPDRARAIRQRVQLDRSD